jgi:hypothetical protein
MTRPIHVHLHEADCSLDHDEGDCNFGGRDSFAEVERHAAKEYGSEAAGKRVAAAVGFAKYGRKGMERKTQAARDRTTHSDAANSNQKRDEAGRFAMGAQGRGGVRGGETANTPSEHRAATVFHGKMSRFHRNRGESEHASAHAEASENHRKARHGGGFQGQVAREWSQYANKKSGLNKGFHVTR